MRIVKIKEQGPVDIQIGTEHKLICMCGLSSTKPFCDRSHHMTHAEEPGKIYRYDEHGRHEVKDS